MDDYSVFWEATAAIGSSASAIISFVAICTVWYQYKKESSNNKQAVRSRILADYNWHYMQNDSIKNVINALHKNNFSSISAYDIEMFMRFFEELYMLIHTDNRMKKDVSRYMFSFYAIMACDSELFWQRLAETTQDQVDYIKSAKEWSLFRKYVKEMKSLDITSNSEITI